MSTLPGRIAAAPLPALCVAQGFIRLITIVTASLLGWGCGASVNVRATDGSGHDARGDGGQAQLGVVADGGDGLSNALNERDASVEGIGSPHAGDAMAGDAGNLPALPDGTCAAWSGPAELAVLFVGNSQIEFHDLPRLVSVMSESAPADCPRIAGTKFIRGGAPLHDLLTYGSSAGQNLLDTIAHGGWDVVVLAESIHLVDWNGRGYPEQFIADATELVTAIRDAGATPILYATPHVESQIDAGFKGMAAPQIELGKELDVTVAAGGLAWLRVWEVEPSLYLHYSDHGHPGPKGDYISAGVLYAAVTGATPVGLSRNYDGFWQCEVNDCEISEAEAQLFQEAAWAQHLATGVK